MFVWGLLTIELVSSGAGKNQRMAAAHAQGAASALCFEKEAFSHGNWVTPTF